MMVTEEFQNSFPGEWDMTTMTIQMRGKGVITLPVQWRRQYGLS